MESAREHVESHYGRREILNSILVHFGRWGKRLRGLYLLIWHPLMSFIYEGGRQPLSSRVAPY